MHTAGTVHLHSKTLSPEVYDAHAANGQRANPRRRDFRGMRQNPSTQSTRPTDLKSSVISYQCSPFGDFAVISGQWANGGEGVGVVSIRQRTATRPSSKGDAVEDLQAFGKQAVHRISGNRNRIYCRPSPNFSYRSGDFGPT